MNRNDHHDLMQCEVAYVSGFRQCQRLALGLVKSAIVGLYAIDHAIDQHTAYALEQEFRRLEKALGALRAPVEYDQQRTEEVA